FRSAWVSWIDHQPERLGSGGKFSQKVQAFRAQQMRKQGCACQISARLVQTFNELLLDGIGASREHNGNFRGCRFGHEGNSSAVGANQVDRSPYQFNDEHSHLIWLTVDEALFDSDI